MHVLGSDTIRIRGVLWQTRIIALSSLAARASSGLTLRSDWSRMATPCAWLITFRPVSEKCQRDRPGVEFLEGDLREYSICDAAVRDIDVVFHIAALPSVPRSLREPLASHGSNVTATLNVVEAARRAGVRRVVYSSSSSVYGDTAVLPKVESVELFPKSPYAAAKLAGEYYVLAYARAGLVEGVALATSRLRAGARS